MKKALIFGITGQDGSYMAELLLEKGYEVHGMYRRSATGNTRNIEPILNRIVLHRGDLADVTSIYRVIGKVEPVELYNFADQDHVGWSYDLIDYASDITGSAVARILECVQQTQPSIRVLQPVSSNIFGRAESPQTEETPLRPQSPYGCAKAYAFLTARYYRDVHNLFCTCPIFYNQESPRRHHDFVTRKITTAVARIYRGLQEVLYVGDLSIQIDVGYAKEYVEAAWSMLQLPRADDFIICTGVTHSLQALAEEAFKVVGLEAKDYLRVDPTLMRPGKTDVLVGDASKANRTFGFAPRIKMPELMHMMVHHDLQLLDRELGLRGTEGAGPAGNMGVG
ncbi:MAG: GDP-mannose 4,6-dehydratase [Planctomycetes bacterium]|nr:GDP-mannose 4,6-dehydratase [Planctomycetota bacterium]